MNKNLFRPSSSTAKATSPGGLTRNRAGGVAYVSETNYALALAAVTGTFNGTFYATGADLLTDLTRLLDLADPAFVARVAVAGAEAKMKDVPAFLTAWLMGRDAKLFEAVFPRVIRTGKMLATFWTFVRSGRAGRKSLGTAPKRAVAAWFEGRSPEQLFNTSIGVANPSVADVLRAAHPRAATADRVALYGYLSGKNRPEHAHSAHREGFRASSPEALPGLVRELEAFRADPTLPVPNVDFRALSSTKLTEEQWATIGRRMTVVQLLKNLNTLERHGVFRDRGATAEIVRKLSDEAEVRRARPMPYEILAAYRASETSGVPEGVRAALARTIDLATESVPSIEGRIVICPDVSGSMRSSVTGPSGKPSTVSCIDVAALFASALLRRNRDARVMPFEVSVRNDCRLDPNRPVLENATALGSIGGGGTNCAAPLEKIAAEKIPVDCVIFISDYESWAGGYNSRSSTMNAAWARVKAANPGAKLVCIDLTPRTNQATPPGSPDILQVGGFSDRVFEVVSLFTSGAMSERAFLDRIDSIAL